MRSSSPGNRQEKQKFLQFYFSEFFAILSSGKLDTRKRERR